MRQWLYQSPQYNPVALWDFTGSGGSLSGLRSAGALTFARASDGTDFNSAGTLVTQTTDAARFDYNPSTLASLGLLLEGARTNLCLQSEAFGTTWSPANASVSANAATAPDGNATADKLVEASDTSQVHYDVQGTITVTAGTPYTASVFVKAAERTKVRIVYSTTGGVYADADLGAGTIGSATAFSGGTATASGIQACANGWYRIWVAGYGASGTSAAVQIELLDASGNRQYNGDGTSGLYLWGAMLELGSFLSSYIKTTTAAVPRAADSCSILTSAIPFNAAAGTLVVTFDKSNVATAGVIAQFDDGTEDNRITLSVDASANPTATIVTGGVTQCAIDAGTVTAGTQAKFAFAWAANDGAACFNAGTVGTDTSITLPTVTTFRLGTDSAGTTNLFGHEAAVDYYPQRLPDAVLIQQTTA